MNASEMICKFITENSQKRDAKILSWLDAKLLEVQQGDEADRLIASKVVAEFFASYNHFLNLGDLDPDLRPEDDCYLPEQLQEERELRAAWCAMPGNPFEEADFGM